MKIPHKHCEFIKAWADGAEIEETFAGQSGDYGWHAFDGNWEKNYTVFRIKPEPKPDVIRYGMATHWWGREVAAFGDNIKATFDGETGKLKAAEGIA